MFFLFVEYLLIHKLKISLYENSTNFKRRYAEHDYRSDSLRIRFLNSNYFLILTHNFYDKLVENDCLNKVVEFWPCGNQPLGGSNRPYTNFIKD